MRFDNKEVFEQAFDTNKVFENVVQPAYSPLAVSFLGELSKAIFKHRPARQFPDLITFAYYCRKANLLNFKECQLDNSVENNRFGLGVCLHIAPANIPMNFAFSFIMGFLSGNTNIVRLPSKKFEQVDIFVTLYNQMFRDKQFSTLLNKNYFIRSSRQSKKLSEIVSKADALVVWGGDHTVESFRNLTKKTSCVESYFPEKVSSIIINADQLIKKSSEEMAQLCTDFFNDTYLFDQNACSSASMICWYSQKNNYCEAQERFNVSLNSYLAKHYSLDTMSMIEKSLDVVRFCARTGNKVNIKQTSDQLWYLTAANHQGLKPKLGVFINKELSNLNQLSSLLRQNEQTLTYFGFEANQLLAQLIVKPNCLVDRIVPVGKALDIGLIWDGKNMIYTLSKKIDVF